MPTQTQRMPTRGDLYNAIDEQTTHISGQFTTLTQRIDELAKDADLVSLTSQVKSLPKPSDLQTTAKTGAADALAESVILASLAKAADLTSLASQVQSLPKPDDLRAAAKIGAADALAESAVLASLAKEEQLQALPKKTDVLSLATREEISELLRKELQDLFKRLHDQMRINALSLKNWIQSAVLGAVVGAVVAAVVSKIVT